MQVLVVLLSNKVKYPFGIRFRRLGQTKVKGRRLAVGRKAERPSLVPVRASAAGAELLVLVAVLEDQPPDGGEGPAHGLDGVVLEAVRQGDVEHGLAVRRAGAVGVVRIADERLEVTLDRAITADAAVVHEHPILVHEGMAVRTAYFREVGRRAADVREEEGTLNVAG